MPVYSKRVSEAQVKVYYIPYFLDQTPQLLLISAQSKHSVYSRVALSSMKVYHHQASRFLVYDSRSSCLKTTWQPSIGEQHRSLPLCWPHCFSLDRRDSATNYMHIVHTQRVTIIQSKSSSSQATCGAQRWLICGVYSRIYGIHSGTKRWFIRYENSAKPSVLSSIQVFMSLVQSAVRLYCCVYTGPPDTGGRQDFNYIILGTYCSRGNNHARGMVYLAEKGFIY